MNQVLNSTIDKIQFLIKQQLSTISASSAIRMPEIELYNDRLYKYV